MNLEDITPVTKTPVPETMELLNRFNTSSTGLVGYLDEGY